MKLGEKPIEQQPDLAGMRRTDDQRETHRPIVVLGSGTTSYVGRRLFAKSVQVSLEERDRQVGHDLPRDRLAFARPESALQQIPVCAKRR
jgi:hypothetical protein